MGGILGMMVVAGRLVMALLSRPAGMQRAAGGHLSVTPGGVGGSSTQVGGGVSGVAAGARSG